jgi:NAD(P)-dependent dehydrogenase (short-subunit alcohol dehydrogenase family)
MIGPVDMSGKVALVTGAGGGIGQASAVALARAGADVALVDLKEEGLAETAARIEALGRRVLILAVDLAEAAVCHGAVASTVTQFGRLDALCNIAGILRLAHSHEMAVDDWNHVIAVNLSAPFLLSQAAIPHLLKVDGAIVNVCSQAAHMGEAYSAAYCASKAGLSQLTKAMAIEYVHTGLRINAISPGGLNTPIGASFVPPEGADMSLLARFRPLRGLVEVDDMAAMITFLASPAARGFHGADINMDKGITAG